MRAFLALLLVLFGFAAPGFANDSIAEKGAGGIELARTDFIEMVSEKLYLSRTLVRVDYVFENLGEGDLETLVAFPMPEVGGNPFAPEVDVNGEAPNYLDFLVEIDGKAVTPELQTRATALGLDVTQELIAAGIPLVPLGQGAREKLNAMPLETLEAWSRRGMVAFDEFDTGDGKGWQRRAEPLWSAQTVLYWTMTFKAGAQTRVHHQYRPAIGGTAGIVFIDYDGDRSSEFAAYAQKYCIDDSFESAVRRRFDDGQNAAELRLDYILTTGANWAGPIGQFRMIVDKGDEAALVSFCGEGVKKTGPTTFEVNYTDFVPYNDMHVLFVGPQE